MLFGLIEDDRETAPGIEVIQAPGHLPGHLIVSAKSGAEQLLFTSDTFIHPIHIEHPEWYTEFETYGEKAVATRTQILEKASQEKALVLSFHFPFPGLGYIIKKNAQFKWLPFEIR